MTQFDFDYIVIGSGAGGGPVAANLAKAGHRVGLIEAGEASEPTSYAVPVFHGYASEERSMSWDFFVRHYSDLAQSKRDEKKFIEKEDGVFYPRAGTLGGCTSHNAMITVYGHNSDWDEIARLTGDSSWSADNMRNYFQRLERCGYVKRPAEGEPNPSRHGWDGWLDTTGPDIGLVFGDKAMLRTILRAMIGTTRAHVGDRSLRSMDPNDWRTPKFEGICFAPLATNHGRRTGTRELIRTVQGIVPDKLVVKMNHLATKILFDADKKAIGVECWEGRHLYRADPNSNSDGNGVGYVKRTYTCAREVILAGGAFNSPQLLMLSGIGPEEQLRKFGIPIVHANEHVGTNLQDRYEVGVISTMKKDWAMLKNASFDPANTSDPTYIEWQNGRGLYTSNGSVLGIIKKSTPERPDPDLFIFALPGRFQGYYPGYSKDVERTKNYLTWLVLKAHTNNTAGWVRLKSPDPRERPEINFKYFDEGNDAAQTDLAAVVAGVKFVRDISRRNRGILEEVLPGKSVKDEDLAQFVKDNAWGHHASCTNAIGKVVDGNFKVMGVQNLRIVDASVFPRIPGFFIVTPIYMIAEKASDVILAS